MKAFCWALKPVSHVGSVLACSNLSSLLTDPNSYLFCQFLIEGLIFLQMVLLWPVC
jgi:hypothetical protein